jgi:hypothetical protein
MHLCAIIREALQLRYTAALIKIAHLSDALNAVCCTAENFLSKLVGGWPIEDLMRWRR